VGAVTGGVPVATVPAEAIARARALLARVDID